MPDLTPDERLELETHRRRRVNAAFRLGSDATSSTPAPSWLGPLAAGVAIGLAGALVVVILTLAHLGR